MTANAEQDIVYISETCKVFLIVAIGGNTEETKTALRNLSITDAIEYFSKYYPCRRKIKERICGHEPLNKFEVSYGDVKPFQVDAFSGNWPISLIITEFQKRAIN